MEQMERQKQLEELLRQQMELLAERSKTCGNEDLTKITSAMLEVYRELKLVPSFSSQFFPESD